MTTTSITPDISTLSSAIETRDSEGILAWFAPDAVLTILDRDHPPAAPATYSGLDEIGAYFRDVCGRNINHRIENAIVTGAGLAYTQHCRYPDGAQVICSAVASLDHGLITHQTAIQVWDA